ncbi:sterol desaturase family protein [Rariglobus hedericola]|uniref:Sterol desaturase family protein n=2 Tax=Rariglobus hedericola TaxID=2597822 RepID=A0A556QSJ5_9BACT|nr:sterol desaturase family protein [Rariglobus hedericola]
MDSLTMSLRTRLLSEFEAPEALRRFGSGWLSGVIGVILGLASLALVLSLLAPGTFSTPELTALRQGPGFRIILNVLLVLAFTCSALSLALRRQGPLLGIAGVSLSLIAVLLGGSNAHSVVGDPSPAYFGLDFFVLRMAFTGILFIPVERLFAHRKEQPVFRTEWREDLFYFLLSSMLVQILTYLTFAPARSILAFAPLTETRAWVSALPFVVQFAVIMFLTDVVQYWVHRSFHRIPWLWNFHAVHHSAQSMDWMAGARMHFFEIVALRSLTVIPMFVLGFGAGPMNAYIFVVYLYATFVHANIGWKFPVIEKFFVTPRFHHWHHGIEKEAIDVNFAVHFPLLDKLFGTHHLPENRWPEGYGIEGHPVERGYWAQFMHPFRRKKPQQPDVAAEKQTPSES